MLAMWWLNSLLEGRQDRSLETRLAYQYCLVLRPDITRSIIYCQIIQCDHTRLPSLLIQDSNMLSTLDKICPTFITYYIRIWSVYLSKKFGKKQKSYDGVNELEEEEFSITSLPQENMRSHEEIYNSSAAASLHTFAYPITSITQIKKQTQEQPKEEQEQELGQFRMNLQPYDKHYDTIKEKTNNIEGIFGQAHAQIELDLGHNRPNFKVFEIPTTTGFKFLLTYQLPCSYSFYHSANNNVNAVSLFSRNIESFELLETVYPNLSLFGLSFKKILGLGLEPRRFNYLKYTNNAGECKHWEVVVSLSTGQAFRSSNSSTTKQADVFSLTHVREGTHKKETKIWVKTYLQLDLRSIIKAPKIVAKGLREVGYYLQNFYQHAQNNYHQEVA